MSPGAWSFVARPSGLPPPSPPPPSVPLSHPITATTIEVQILASGAVDDYTEADKQAIGAVIADKLGVPASVVSIAISSASVLITATITTSSTAEAASVISTLEATFVDENATTAVLRTAVPSITVTAAPTVRTVSVSQETSTPSLGVLHAAILAPLLLLLAAAAAGGLWFWRCRRRRLKLQYTLEARCASKSKSSTSHHLSSQAFSSPSLPSSVTLSDSQKMANEASPPPAPWASARKQAPPCTSDELTRFDIFVSFTNKDIPGVATSLIALLTSKGAVVFNQKRDFAGAPVNRQAMESVVMASKVVLALITPSYFDSEPCRWEVEAAANAGVVVVPVHAGEHHTPHSILKMIGLRDDPIKGAAARACFCRGENLIDVCNIRFVEQVDKEIDAKIIKRFLHLTCPSCMDQWEWPSEEVVWGDELGAGSFGTVFRVQCGGMVLAAKCINIRTGLHHDHDHDHDHGHDHNHDHDPNP